MHTLRFTCHDSGRRAAKTAFGFIVLMLLSTAALADGACTFQLMGVVRWPTCLPAAPGDLRPACEIWVEVADEGETMYTSVDCSDPGVIDACRALTNDDPVMIVGVEGPPRWGLASKRATQVGFWLHEIPPYKPGAGDSSNIELPPESGYLQLALGQTRAFADLRIRYSELVQDSRCPADVECPWEGRCAVRIEIWEKEYLGSYDLTMGGDPADAELDIAGCKIRFEELLPKPGGDPTIAAALMLWIEEDSF